MTERNQMEGRNSRGRFMKGNKHAQKHGVYALSRPSIRGIRLLRQHLDHLKGQLEEQLRDLTPHRELLVGNILRCEEKLALLDMFFKKAGLIEGDKFRRGKISLQPATSFYVALMNSQRLSLQALGLDHLDIERPMTPAELAAVVIEENKETKKENEHTTSHG